MTDQVTTFVLVHGAWGGSYGFKYVRGPLRQAGHEVFTPSLTGIGERAHLASPQVDLTTHVTDVVNTILYEDLNDIVLLGYSYGGMVVTGALEHVADRVAHLVYLDAFKPDDGQSLADLTGAPYRAPAISRACEDRPGVAVPGGRHRPHDPDQPPGRTGRAAP
jgi:pimeloyl-ACP methyl ester carboxylesterase